MNKINGYIEERSENNYLMLVHTDESKDTLIKDKNLWNKTRDTFTSVTNRSDNHDEKYTRIKFNSVFHQGNK